MCRASALWLCCLAAAFGASAGQTPVAPPASGAWAALDEEVSRGEAKPIVRHASEKKTIDRDAQPALGASWLRTMLSLGVVVILVVLLAAGWRAVTGGSLTPKGAGRARGAVQMLARTPISARQSLCLVRVGSRVMLIGQSPDALTALGDVDDAALLGALLSDSRRGAEFDKTLHRESEAYSSSESTPTAAGVLREAAKRVETAVRKL